MDLICADPGYAILPNLTLTNNLDQKKKEKRIVCVPIY